MTNRAEIVLFSGVKLEVIQMWPIYTCRKSLEGLTKIVKYISDVENVSPIISEIQLKK